ncbi:MAG: FRG domain-containing protein [Pseudomonadota bacterium]
MSYIYDNLIHPDNEFLYRGQKNSEWELEPTITRYIRSNSKCFEFDYRNSKDLKKIVEKKLWDAYKTNLKRNLDVPDERVEKLDLWQFGQHHGLPTPLLDWTKSPYIGLFFAICDDSDEKDYASSERALWVLNQSMLRHINSMIEREVWPSLVNLLSESLLYEQFPKMEVVQSLDGENRRLVFQQGVFTKHVYYTSFEDWLKRITSELTHDIWNERLLTKIIFPSDMTLRNELMAALDKMNVNYRTLFPDRYGSAADAAECVKQNLRQNRMRHFSGTTSDEKLSTRKMK